MLMKMKVTLFVYKHDLMDLHLSHIGPVLDKIYSAEWLIFYNFYQTYQPTALES